jgi:hypothetical protein
MSFRPGAEERLFYALGFAAGVAALACNCFSAAYGTFRFAHSWLKAIGGYQAVL